MPRCRRRTVSLVLILGVFALLFCSYNRTPTIDDNEQNYGSSYSPVVGMHIGNANCRVALARHIDMPHRDETRHIRSMPACVTFTESGALIGNDTKEHIVDNPHNTICGIKDLLGHKWSDPKLQAYIKNLPYEVVEVDDEPMIKIRINDETKLISPEYVYSILLGRLRDVAQEFLKENVTDAVVAVPAYYNDLQRQAVKDSGQTVNLTVLRIVNEPTAASIAYGIDSSSSLERLVLVYDIGATETNVAVLEVDAGVFDILGTATASVGGNDFNKRVLDRITTMLEKRQWASITSDTRAVRKLWTVIDQAKKDISVNYSSRISLKEFHNGSGPNETVLTRGKFEDLNRDLFFEALKPVTQVLNDMKVKASQIDDIVLVGGSVRIPKIQMMLEEYFNRKTLRGITPDHAIVLGAALQGAILSGIDDGDFPCCVDINPLSVGIETTRGVFRKIIPRNTPIPTRKTQNFTTVSDDQTSMLIRIFEGERVFTKNNKFLGELVLSGIRPAPKGEAVIQVSFEYYYDNIKVYAEDKATGHNATFSTEDTGYNRSGRFENLDQIIFEAENHAQEDSALLETIVATIEIPNSVAAHGDLLEANEPQKEEL